MFCVWQNNEHDWIKPAAGVGVSRGLFLTLSSSDSRLGISKQNLQKSQRPSATPREQKSPDNEEENETWENLWPQLWCLCAVGPEAPRDRFKFPIIPPSQCLRSLGVRADICWWEKWTMVTIVTGHDSCQSHRRLPQCGGTFTNLDWIRPTSNNCEVFIFMTDRWIETIIANFATEVWWYNQGNLKETLMCGERLSLSHLHGYEFQTSKKNNKNLNEHAELLL